MNMIEQQGGYNPTERLGKKLGNRCGSAFNSSQLVLAGGYSSGEVAKAQQLMPHLEGAVMPAMDPVERGGFNVRLPKTYEAMLFIGKGASKEGYVEALGGLDHDNLPQVGINLSTNSEASGVVLRTVFGGTEEMPLRAISYMLPPLVYLEGLRGAGAELPQLQIIFANNISSTLNRLDEAKAKDQAGQLAAFAKEYTAEYFPELADSIVFLEDTPLEKGSTIRNELLSVVGTLHAQISDQTREQLLGKGNNGSSRLNPFYGAAHLLVHDASMSGILTPILEDQPAVVEPKTIISFGSYQEKLFYSLRHELKPHLGSDYQSIPTLQYFTKHRVPPYYMARGGDYSLEDAFQGVDYSKGEIAKAAQYDLGYLQDVTEARGTVDFAEFIAYVGGRIAA